MNSRALGLTAVLVVLLQSACAQGPHNTAIKPLPGQTLDDKDVLTCVKTGSLDGEPFRLLISLRVLPVDGHVAVCGAIQQLGKRNLTDRMGDGLALEKSTLVLTRKADAVALTMAPSFLPLTYRAPGPDGRTQVTISDQAGQRAGCAVTSAAWQPQWENNQVTGALKLYLRDLRRRDQSVVGTSGAEE